MHLQNQMVHECSLRFVLMIDYAVNSRHHKAMAETLPPPKSKKPTQERGKLRIGDHWNAITIIALSQSSPLKAIAEMVENSIDAKATTITITRGRVFRPSRLVQRR